MVETKSRYIEKAKQAKRESKYIDFKESFDTGSDKDWCEIIKDIVAMANSGGGAILFGLNNKGKPSGKDITPILDLDLAKITDKIEKYTGEIFSDFSIEEMKKSRTKVVTLVIYGEPPPFIFTRPGTYSIGEGKQKCAFSKGTIYFRHGAKSEPGKTSDIKNVIKMELNKIKNSWLKNVRKVTKAPVGYDIKMLPPEIRESDEPMATPIRITDDPSAPAYQKISPDQSHPNRLKEVVELINEKIGEKKIINAYDILCVRRVHGIDNKYQFFYKSKFAAPQYTPSFVDWLLAEHKKDESFFDKSRELYKKLQKK